MPCYGINKKNKCYVDVYSVQESDMMAYKPNLLINGDFQCNQRGLSGYTPDQYSCDMWYGVGDYVGWTAKGIVLFDVWQKIEALPNDKYVFSYRINNTSEQKAIVLDSNNDTKDDGYLRVTLTTEDTDTKISISTVSGEQSDRLNFVRLDKGTLAVPHVREDYVIALNRCRRYLQVYPTMYSTIEMYYSSKKFISVANFEKMQSKPNATIGSAKFYDTSMNYVSAPVSTVVCTTDTMEVRTSEATNEKHASTFTLKLFDVVISCEPL